jgi:hypothetical protein
MINVRDFGALGDGKTDDTAAFKTALERAGHEQGTVYVPAGIYLCGEIRVPRYTTLRGEATWGFSRSGGTILRLHDSEAKCLVNLTGAQGCRLIGIGCDGSAVKTDRPIHGIMVDNPQYATEDGMQIDACRVEHFSGDGFHFERLWCFSVRHSHAIHNKGCGMRVRGWDAFLLDNWLSGNGKAGLGCYDENASMTITANRIEWNREEGIVAYGGNHYSITGNYIDRSGRCGIALYHRGDGWHHTFAITGNVIYRSGKPEHPKRDEYDSAHVRFDGTRGLVFSGNAMNAGRDDNGGVLSPDYGIVIQGLGSAIIKDNVLHEAAMKQLIVDRGGHVAEVILKDNVGSLRPHA